MKKLSEKLGQISEDDTACSRHCLFLNRLETNDNDGGEEEKEKDVIPSHGSSKEHETDGTIDEHVDETKQEIKTKENTCLQIVKKNPLGESFGNELVGDNEIYSASYEYE